jgi:hypothetical protein
VSFSDLVLKFLAGVPLMREEDKNFPHGSNLLSAALSTGKHRRPFFTDFGTCFKLLLN